MIDEKKLIERLQRCVDAADNSNFTNGLLSAIDVVNQQPKIGEWIPCNERLPEPGHRYLVSVVWEDEGAKTYSVYDAVYGSDAKWHSHNYECMIYCKIVAWQPLPEPYRDLIEEVK